MEREGLRVRESAQTCEWWVPSAGDFLAEAPAAAVLVGDVRGGGGGRPW